MTRVCAGITRSGGRCTVPVSGAQHFCHLHDPARAEERRRAASRAGRSKPGREIAEIRGQLRQLYADVLSGQADRGAAAVAAQVANVRLRALELQRKILETQELEERVEEMERALRGEGGVYGVR